MPNRLVREGLMESERVLALPVEARWLFVIIVLSADDVGLFEATEFKLARRADVNRDLAGTLLSMLSDQDLVRFYEVDGKRFGFIPRFRQRIQLKRMKHPAPPAGLMSDDKDALNKINDLASRTTVGQPLDNGCASDGQPSEAEAEAEEETISSSSSKKTRRQRKAGDTRRVPNCPYAKLIEAYHEILPELPKVRLPETKREGLQSLWKWCLTSTKTNGARRATTSEEGVAWMRSYFERARSNDLLMGRIERTGRHSDWRADLDFLLTRKGLLHVIEKTEVVET